MLRAGARMPALSEEVTIEVLRHGIRRVKEGAGIGPDDPFSLVLDANLQVSEAALQAAWRTREGLERTSTNLHRATVDLEGRLAKLEEKLDYQHARFEAAQERASRVMKVCTIVVALCVVVLLASAVHLDRGCPAAVSDGPRATSGDAGPAPDERTDPGPTGGEQGR